MILTQIYIFINNPMNKTQIDPVLCDNQKTARAAAAVIKVHVNKRKQKKQQILFSNKSLSTSN